MTQHCCSRISHEAKHLDDLGYAFSLGTSTSYSKNGEGSQLFHPQ